MEAIVLTAFIAFIAMCFYREGYAKGQAAAAEEYEYEKARLEIKARISEDRKNFEERIGELKYDEKK